MKNRFRIRMPAFVFLAVILSDAQTASDLGQQLDSLHVHTALVVRSQEMDDLPVWSPDGKFLAVDLAGKWVKVDISEIHLQEAKWHGQRVGVQSKANLQPMTNEEIRAWGKPRALQKSDREVVTTESGLKIEIRHHEMSSSLVISKGARRSVIWESDLENCYGLTLAPDKLHVAYLCELNGILVMDPQKAFGSAGH